MSCEDLIKAIGENTCLAQVEILSRSEAEVETIIQGAEARRKARLEQARLQGIADAREDVSRIMSRARLKAKQEVLAARYQLIEETMRSLEAKLRILMDTEKYRSILMLLLEDCLAETSGPVTIRCRREDRRIVEDYALSHGLDVSVTEVPFPLGGLETAAGPDGSFIRRNTLADHIEQNRPRLLQEAGRLLFGPAEDGP